MNSRMDKTKTIDFLKKQSYLIFMFLSFFSTELLLRYYTNSIGFMKTFDITTTLFNVFWILIMVAIFSMLSQRIGRILYAIVSIVFTILFAAQYIYFQIFNKFFWINDAVVAKEGGEYAGYIINHFDWHFFVIIVTGVIFTILSMITYRKGKRVKKDYIKAGSVLAFSIFMLMLVLPDMLGKTLDDEEPAWDGWKNPRKIYDAFGDQNRYVQVAGFYSYTFRDIYTTFFPDSKSITEMHDTLDAYYADKSEPTTNDYTGVFEGKNVVMVMMESMDDFTISKNYTPTLYYMQENGINFDQHYATIFGAGGTFNSEFTSMTGFHSPNVGNAAYTYGKNALPYTLPNLLNEKGYTSTSFHFNTGTYYNRTLMHETFGFDEHVSFLDQGGVMEEVEFDTYAVETDAMYQRMIEKKPFFDFYITYSAHLPYNYNNNICDTNLQKYPQLIDESLSEEVLCVNLQAKETDDYFKTLLTRLNEDNLLEDTVIIAYTDHKLYGLSDQEVLTQLNEEAGDFIGERVPFIVFNYGSNINIQVDKVSNTTDILPTVLNLLGVQRPKYYLGSDIFDDEYSGYVFYPDGTWYNGDYYYTGEDGITPYIEAMNAQVQQRLELNDMVLNSDYFRYLNK